MDDARIHVFYGNDEFQAAEALQALKQRLDTDGSLATNTTVLAGRGLSPNELIQHASTPPFLAPARLVIVEGLLTALGSRRGVAEPWQPLIDALPHLPETNHIVLLEPVPRPGRGGRTEGGPGRSPLLAALRNLPNVDVQEFKALQEWARNGPSPLAQWLQGRAVRQGISLTPEALTELAERIGPNLRMLATELEKLRAYAGDRTITAEDVALLTARTRDENVFAMVDAIVEGRATLVLQQLRRLLDEDHATSESVRFMLHRQLRLLVRATDLLERGASQDEVAEATKQRGFPLTKLMRQARATTRTASEAGLRAAEAFDHSVKRGRIEEDVGLELLVVRLAELAPRAARQRR